MSIVKQPHIDYLASQFAIFDSNVSNLTENLKNSDIAEEYGFDVIDITREAIRRHTKQESFIDLVFAHQTKYLADFSNIKLAHKKERAKELIKLYESIDEMKKIDGKHLAESVRFDKKLMVLRDIRAEMGDDIERLAKAIEKEKTVNVNISAKDAILGRYEPINDNTGITDSQTTVQ